MRFLRVLEASGVEGYIGDSERREPDVFGTVHHMKQWRFQQFLEDNPGLSPDPKP